MGRAARRRAPGLSPGTLVADRFRLEAKLGEGGMAEVFRAEEVGTGRRVAVKVLHSDVATNPEAAERARREGQVLSELDNPAIVSVEAFGEHEGAVFLVMELLEGETLGRRMKRGTLEPVELAPIVAGTCAGLHAAHSRGIVHRDLKPDNVFLCPTEHGLQVKLLDFGISKVYGGEKLTQTGEILGTPRYMSPEQLGAEPDIDARVDIYALGVILYEALAGKPPFLASTPTDLVIAILNGKVAPLRSVRTDVSSDVEAVVMRAMSRTRAARYDTAMELAEAFVDAVGGPAAVRSQQRRGMATRALGGALVAPVVSPTAGVPDTRPPPAPERSDAVAGHLRIGTFSGMESSSAPSESAEAIGHLPTAQMGAVPGAPVPEAPGAPVARPIQQRPAAEPSAEPRAEPAPKRRREMPPTRQSALAVDDSVDTGEAAPRAAPAPAAKKRRVAPTAMMDPSLASQPSSPALSPPAAPAPPRRSGGLSKVLLVLGALLAGAASAAGVIVALQYLEGEEEVEELADEDGAPSGSPDAEATDEADETPAPPTESEAVAADAESGGDEPGEADGPLEDVADDPGGDDAEDPGASRRREEARERRRRARRERERREREDAREEEAADEMPENPIAAIREAGRALRRGDPERCIRLLDEAIPNGAPSIALRTRADCYEASGRRRDAIRDYQRFCRIAHDSPAIGEVRARLESWGRSCP
ncbi:MAG TPA: protein kinase [Sandaracinaceae bacterium LLY-WYZ-13_1]|nr:protein kinase [Sandaracinaceae bacterium LLY-WYZ-13_1]